MAREGKDALIMELDHDIGKSVGEAYFLQAGIVIPSPCTPSL